ncbi:hypothetical protein D5F01_LYC14634 [Larimichthys crocea]|uniref:Uncharacterized protein n=1 Tax=Larimichthys crocea TaxID=215358 RepID=A0A6G0I5I6_LARCR|nr:hypothetical protein D5F01_LYC14634 [Larimichthys crocea]
MDGASSFLAQRGRAKWDQPMAKSWASSGAPCSIFDGDQVWLEELIGLSSYLSSGDPNNSSPPGGSRNSSEGSGSLHSWSSGAPCNLHGSVKKQNHEVFQSRQREQRGRPHGGAHPQVEQGEGNIYCTIDAWPERAELDQGRSSTQTQTSAKSVKQQSLLEETVNAKRKFSSLKTRFKRQHIGAPGCPAQWPNSRVLYSSNRTQEDQTPLDPAQKTYLETNIDTARRDEEEADEENVIPPPPQFCQGFEMKDPFRFQCDFPRYPHKSASLPRGMNMHLDKDIELMPVSLMGGLAMYLQSGCNGGFHSLPPPPPPLSLSLFLPLSLSLGYDTFVLVSPQVPDEEMNGIDTISLSHSLLSSLLAQLLPLLLLLLVLVVLVGDDCGGSSGLHVDGVSLSF